MTTFKDVFLNILSNLFLKVRFVSFMLYIKITYTLVVWNFVHSSLRLALLPLKTFSKIFIHHLLIDIGVFIANYLDISH